MARSCSVTTVLLCVRSRFRSPSFGRERERKNEPLPETSVTLNFPDSSSVTSDAKETSPAATQTVCTDSNLSDEYVTSHANKVMLSMQDRARPRSSSRLTSWFPFRYNENHNVCARAPSKSSAVTNPGNLAHRFPESAGRETSSGRLNRHPGGCPFTAKKMSDFRSSSYPHGRLSHLSKCMEVEECARNDSGNHDECSGERRDALSPKRGREAQSHFSFPSCFPRRRQKSVCHLEQTRKSNRSPNNVVKAEGGIFYEENRSRGRSVSSRSVRETPVQLELEQFSTTIGQEFVHSSPAEGDTDNLEQSCPAPGKGVELSHSVREVKKTAGRDEQNGARFALSPGVGPPQTSKPFEHPESEKDGDRKTVEETAARQSLKTHDSTVMETVVEIKEEYDCLPHRPDPYIKSRSSRSSSTHKQTSQLRAERRKSCTARTGSQRRNRFPSASRTERKSEGEGKTAFSSYSHEDKRSFHFHNEYAAEPQVSVARGGSNAEAPRDTVFCEKGRQTIDINTKRTLRKETRGRDDTEDSVPTAKRTSQQFSGVLSTVGKAAAETDTRTKCNTVYCVKQTMGDNGKSCVCESDTKSVSAVSDSMKKEELPSYAKDTEQTNQSYSKRRCFNCTDVNKYVTLCGGDTRSTDTCANIATEFQSPISISFSPTENLTKNKCLRNAESPIYGPSRGRAQEQPKRQPPYGRHEYERRVEWYHPQTVTRSSSPSTVSPAAIYRLPSHAQRLTTTFLSNRDIFFSMPPFADAVSLTAERTKMQRIPRVGPNDHSEAFCGLERSGWTRTKKGTGEERTRRNKLFLELPNVAQC